MSLARAVLTDVCELDIYIIGSMLLGSLLIFAGKGITYIDAMLFAAGATSQAGMNPINMNLLNTWQQVTPQARID